MAIQFATCRVCDRPLFFFAPRIHSACTGKLLKALVFVDTVITAWWLNVPGRPTARWWVQFLDPVSMQGMQRLFLGVLWQRSAKGWELVEGVKMRKDRLLQDTITQTFRNHLFTILYRSTILICSYQSLSSSPSTLDVWIQEVYRSLIHLALTRWPLGCTEEASSWALWGVRGPVIEVGPRGFFSCM